MWNHTTPEEKSAIINDLQHFCAPPGHAEASPPDDASP